MPDEKNFDDMGNEYSYPTNTSNNYYVDEGSYLIGFLLVFFLNLLGLIIALVMKKSKTTKGAVITLLIQIGLGVLVGAAILLLIYVFKVIDLEFIQEAMNK